MLEKSFKDWAVYMCPKTLTCRFYSETNYLLKRQLGNFYDFNLRICMRQIPGEKRLWKWLQR